MSREYSAFDHDGVARPIAKPLARSRRHVWRSTASPRLL